MDVLERERIESKLFALSEYRANLAVVQMDKEAAIAQVLTDEVKAKLLEIDAKFDPRIAAIGEYISLTESQIKTAVVDAGESVKGVGIHAVYMKGRVSWDGKSLDGYAAAHPEILTFRKVGDPSVSFITIAEV